MPSLVGRVAAVESSAAVRAAGGDWRDAAVNDPVASGMSLRTDGRGGAILRIGADTIALAADSELAVAELDRQAIRIALRRGRIGVRLSPRAAAAGVSGTASRRRIEVDIPRGEVSLLQPGDYDIAAGAAQIAAGVAVFGGRSRFVGKGVDTLTPAGSAITLSGSDPVVASLDSGISDDEFTDWWQAQAGDDAEATALHYVSPDMTGFEELDGNGSWEAVDGYGMVWFPKTVPDGWAPYRDGNWRWITPWGWTWIDAMPWGFAPSHYGRWASVPGADPGTERWGWVPGDRVADPVYAPALVAFLGTRGVGLSYPDASGPAVAWFPLAPGEVYWPSYTRDPDMIRRLNDGVAARRLTLGPDAGGMPPAAVITAEYKNRAFASVVPRAVFVAGRPVASALVRLPRERLDNAPLLAGSPQIAPPMPHPIAVASAAAPAGGPAPTSPRFAQTPRRAVRLVARATPVRPRVVVSRSRVRPRIVLAVIRHWRGQGVRIVRPHVIAAVATRTARLHPRLPATHRRLRR